MADHLDVTIKRNPHLGRYLRRYESESGSRPTFVETLSREMSDEADIDLLYPVGDPIFVHVYGTKETDKRYAAIEPELSESAKSHFDAILNLILFRSADKPVHASKEEFESIIDEILEESVYVTDAPRRTQRRGRKVRRRDQIEMLEEEFDSIEYYVKRNIIENGQIEPLLRDPYIEDIHCIGMRLISLVHKVFGFIETNVRFATLDEIDKFTRTMSERIGRMATMRSPIVDGALPDGSRINIIYASDVSIGGPSFTIRKFSAEPLSIVQLVKWRTLSSLEAAYIWLCLENGMSVFVCGETASGKTTLLNASFPLIKYDSKVYTAEDTLEVQPPHKVWQQLSTREFGPEESRVDTFSLLKAALRSRPNYIVVGEIRGKEGNVAFQAMQAGLSVMATFHASSIKRMIQRFAGSPINVPITSMDSLNVAVFLAGVYRRGRFLRRVLSIDEVLGYSATMGGVMTRSVFVWNPSTDEHIFRGMNNSYVLEEKIATKLSYRDRRQIYVDLQRKEKIIDKMLELNIVSYKDVLDTIVAYQKEGVEGLPFPL